MSIIQSIPILPVPNQTLSVTLKSGQTINIAINTYYANSKALIGNDADPDEDTINFCYCTVTLNGQQIIINAPIVHAQNINQYFNNEVQSLFSGYLFFYVSTTESGGSDAIDYNNFGSTITLYWSDTNITEYIYANWVNANLVAVQQKFVFVNL